MEEGEDVLDPLLVVWPPLDPVSACHQRYRPCRIDTNSGRPQMTPKTLLTGRQAGLPDSCTPMMLKGLWAHVPSLGHILDQLECKGFLDSLHDPPAYVAPHNISDVAIPVYKHPLMCVSSGEHTSAGHDTQRVQVWAPSCRSNANRNTHFMVHHLGEWRHPRIPRQHHRRMRMAVSAMITTQDEGPTWAWFCVAPDVPAGKLWWVAWCASRLLDHTPNDVAQKPQTCDVILSSMGEVRLWRGASYRCWNDDFWLETCAILHQWDSYTWSDDSRRHLDIMLAASLEWPFALRMARRVSTHVDLTAGSD